MSDFSRLSQCLDNTTNSYKYLVPGVDYMNAPHIDAARICRWHPSQGVHEQNGFLMMALAWYPISQAVSYGSQDRLAEAIKALIHILEIRRRSD